MDFQLKLRDPLGAQPHSSLELSCTKQVEQAGGKAWLKIGLSVPNGCNMRGVSIVRANLILSL